jgi:hypothetical protein
MEELDQDYSFLRKPNIIKVLDETSFMTSINYLGTKDFSGSPPRERANGF